MREIIVLCIDMGGFSEIAVLLSQTGRIYNVPDLPCIRFFVNKYV